MKPMKLGIIFDHLAKRESGKDKQLYNRGRKLFWSRYRLKKTTERANAWQARATTAETKVTTAEKKEYRYKRAIGQGIDDRKLMAQEIDQLKSQLKSRPTLAVHEKLECDAIKAMKEEVKMRERLEFSLRDQMELLQKNNRLETQLQENASRVSFGHVHQLIRNGQLIP